MDDLEPPNLKDPFIVGFVIVWGVVYGIVAYIALNGP